MSGFPEYNLYQSDGTTLVYYFEFAQSDNSPQDPKDFVEIEGLRGQGSIIIPGSTKAWDLQLGFLLIADDYEDLIAQMDALESTILQQTPYVLKIDRTISTTKDYHVMRLSPFSFSDISDRSLRVKFQRVVCNFRVNCW